MASYSTMNTIPAADVSETPLLQRDVKINAKTVVGGAALAAFVLGALAATAVDLKAPVRSTAFSTGGPYASDLTKTEFAHMASVEEFGWWAPPVPGVIINSSPEPELDGPTGKFSYDSFQDKFVWKNPPFGGAGDDNTAIYNIDNTSLADKGLYKIWRDGSGGYYTVSLERSLAGDGYFLAFKCRANDQWDDLSDQC